MSRTLQPLLLAVLFIPWTTMFVPAQESQDFKAQLRDVNALDPLPFQGEEASRPHCTAHQHHRIKNATVIFSSCSERTAREWRTKMMGQQHCVGANDPQCGGACFEKKKCQVVALDYNYRHPAFNCVAAPNPGCAGGSGLRCTWTVTTFNCGCACYDAPPRGTTLP